MSNDPKKPTEQPKKAEPAKQQSQSAPAKGAALNADKCKMEECKKKPDHFGFCHDHYEMYMSGVIRGDGAKPSDYQEKLAWHLSKTKKAAA